MTNAVVVDEVKRMLMPHQTLWENKGIYWRFSGVVTLDEQELADGEMYGDPRFDELEYFIWDGTDIDKVDYHETEADEPAAIDKVSSVYKPNLKGALIAKTESVKLVVQRYIKTSIELGSSWEFKMFDSLEQAREWLAS
jgi:hypothetical protein